MQRQEGSQLTAAFYGLLAWALLVGSLAGWLAPDRRLLLALGTVGLALTPLLAGESLAMGLHGAFGAPSLTLVQLACWRWLAAGSPVLLTRRASLLVLALAAVFYPLALGLGPWDPYGLGYQPGFPLLALLPLAAWLAWRRQQAWLVILGLDLLAYALGFFGNLWDAFIDPLLALAALAALLRNRRR